MPSSIQGEAELFDLTPRKEAMMLDSSPSMDWLGNAAGLGYRLEAKDGLSSEAKAGLEMLEASQRGRTRKASPNSPRRRRPLDKENAGAPNTSPPGGQDSLTKAALKRQQVVDKLSQAQIDERTRLCIFKAKAEAGPAGQAGDGHLDSEPITSNAHQEAEGLVGRWAEGLRPEETSRRWQAKVGKAHLTVPHGPMLQTGLRSRSLSVDARFGTPLRGCESVGEPNLSRCSRTTSRERTVMGTPEQSVRSVKSMRSVLSTTSVFTASLAGRFVCTRPLTFPKGPNLATASRSRSLSVGAHTPERQNRSLSVHSARSARSASRTRPNLTVPRGPLLSTEVRSRSRSCGTATPERSLRSSSVRSTYSCHSVTVPRGPVLATELRSRSRVRTPSAHSVGSHTSFRSCSSARAPSVRSLSAQPRSLTVPVGPLLATQIRSWSRSRRACTPNAQDHTLHMSVGHSSVASALSADELPQEAQVQDVPVRVENIPKPQREQPSQVVCAGRLAAGQLAAGQLAASKEQNQSPPSACMDSIESQKDLAGEVVADLPEPLGSNLEADALARRTWEINWLASNADALADQFVATERAEAEALASAPSPLSEYLPVTPQSTPLAVSGAESSQTSGKVAQQLQASGISAQQRICEGQDGMASAESRALAKKKQMLAKMAQEQANTRKERFVFGRPGTTPTRKKDLKLTPVSKPEPASVALPPVEQDVNGK